ncbi:hypothetical protein BKA62DRAFT_676808 [Auriculariales sp. MPI-PUGE-AT-0066]|nr:hypothetical protein BKA62DRAFT_676808 [Auriculariales sp. MPI-PUGE-AT-0066]
MAGTQPGGLAMYQVKVRNLGGARRPRAGVGYMSEHTETIGGSTETIGSNRKGTWNLSGGGTNYFKRFHANFKRSWYVLLEEKPGYTQESTRNSPSLPRFNALIFILNGREMKEEFTGQVCWNGDFTIWADETPRFSLLVQVRRATIATVAKTKQAPSHSCNSLAPRLGPSIKFVYSQPYRPSTRRFFLSDLLRTMAERLNRHSQHN